MRKYLAFLFLFAWPADASVRCSTSPCIDTSFDATADHALTGAISVLDESFTIEDTADTTKVFNLETGSITAGNTRVGTWPDASGTVSLIGLAETFSGNKTFTGPTNSFSGAGAFATLRLKDDGGSGTNRLELIVFNDLDNNYALYIAPGNSDRILTISADVSLNQNVLTTSTPTFVGLLVSATAFASLGTPSNGTVLYCNDCTIANPCAGAGTGAIAKRLNGAWVCN